VGLRLLRRQHGKVNRGDWVFEVDDAKYRDGQYDVKLDMGFKVSVIARD
jgi:hypothetical protein